VLWLGVEVCPARLRASRDKTISDWKALGERRPEQASNTPQAELKGRALYAAHLASCTGARTGTAVGVIAYASVIAQALSRSSYATRTLTILYDGQTKFEKIYFSVSKKAFGSFCS
jgi:hypothetical protein